MDPGRPSAIPKEPALAGDAVAIGGVASRLYRNAIARALSVWEIWPLMAFALVTSIVYLRAAPYLALPFDDSYISLRFARNLADHGFLTFDGESASAGATSLLHVALLALPIKLGVAPEKASVAFGLTTHLALVPAVYWLSWTIFKDRVAAALGAGSVGVVGFLVFDSLNGMETTLFLLVTTLAVAAFFSARDERGVLAAGGLAALAVVTRPEGVLLLGAMVLYYVVNPERNAPVISQQTLRRVALLAGPGAIALAGLAIFYWATTGSLTPGTATAKFLFFGEFELSRQTRFEFIQGGVANFLAPVLPWLALALFSLRRREVLLFAFFWIAFMLMYYMLLPGATAHYWYRYQHVFLPAIMVFGAAGFVTLLRGQRFRSWDLVPAGIIGAVLLGAIAFQYNSFRNNYADDIQITSDRQIAAAEFLRDTTPADATIATHDIGAIGYISERDVIDLVGLDNPDAVEHHSDRTLRQYVDEVQPDYIVAFASWENRYLQIGLAQEPELFRQIAVFEGGFDRFVVYETNYD